MCCALHYVYFSDHWCRNADTLYLYVNIILLIMHWQLVVKFYLPKMHIYSKSNAIASSSKQFKAMGKRQNFRLNATYINAIIEWKHKIFLYWLPHCLAWRGLFFMTRFLPCNFQFRMMFCRLPIWSIYEYDDMSCLATMATMAIVIGFTKRSI